MRNIISAVVSYDDSTNITKMDLLCYESIDAMEDSLVIRLYKGDGIVNDYSSEFLTMVQGDADWTVHSVYFEDDRVFEKVFTEQMPAPEKASMYSVLDENQKVISEWENLANLDLSMGDFSAYLNCSGQLIKALDKNAQDWSKEELASYKSTIYENIANNMFEYDPEQTREIADKTLEDLQKSQDKDNFTDLCTKMIQGALNHGEYLYALGLTHKILTAMNDASIDPSAKNFDLKFLLMSIVHIKILFGIGAFNDCSK